MSYSSPRPDASPVLLAVRRAGVALSGLALGSLALYWFLWTPAYRLSERFEYPDLLFAAFPAVAHVLAAQHQLVATMAPLAVTSAHGARLLWAALMLGLFGLYFAALWLAGRVSARCALAITAAFTLGTQLVLLPLPGVFSTDLFSYAFYGEMSGRYGDSPYVASPDHYPTNPLYLLINPLWRDAPSVYGPVWIAVSHVVGAAAGGAVLPQVLAYRVIADVCHWLNLAALWWGLTALRPRAAGRGLAVYAWNPLVVFEFAGNGHNDGLLILFLLLGLGFLARRRDRLGVVAVVLSVGAKYTSVLVLPLVLWWTTRALPLGRRLLAVGAAGAGALLAVALLYLPWWRGADTLGPIIYWLSTPLYAHHPPLAVALWLRDLLAQGLGLTPEDAESLALGVVRQLGRLGFLVYLAVEAWRLRQASDLPAACARVLVVFLLAVNTWVLAWYYTWPLALAALSPLGSRTAWLVLGLTATAPLSMYWAQTHQTSMDVPGYVFYLAPVAALAMWEGGRRLAATRGVAVYGALRTLTVGGRSTSCAPGSTPKK